MIFISFLISIGGVVSVDYLFFQSNISVNFLIKILNFIIFSCGIFVFSNFIGIVLGTLLKSITSGIILAIIIIHNLTLLLWLFLNKVFSQIHISFSQLKVLPFLLGFLVIIFSFCFVLYLNISKSSKL